MCTYYLNETKTFENMTYQQKAEEQFLTFYQITIPILLLLLKIIQIFEIWKTYRKYRDNQTQYLFTEKHHLRPSHDVITTASNHGMTSWAPRSPSPNIHGTCTTGDGSAIAHNVKLAVQPVGDVGRWKNGSSFPVLLELRHPQTFSNTCRPSKKSKHRPLSFSRGWNLMTISCCMAKPSQFQKRCESLTAPVGAEKFTLVVKEKMITLPVGYVYHIYI